MESTIHKADLALLEGDREEVVRLLENVQLPDGLSQPEKRRIRAQIAWLSAQALMIGDEELENHADAERRNLLLTQVVDSQVQPYCTLASQILQRKEDFHKKANEPAPYQFWKRPGVQKFSNSLQKKRRPIVWFSFTLLAIALLITGLLIWQNRQQRASQALFQQTEIAFLRLTEAAQTVVPTPSVTPLPASMRTAVSYPGGSLSLVRYEFPTGRQVVFSLVSNSTPAVPAKGAVFAAFEVEFNCGLAVCGEPPEAEIALELSDGKRVSYRATSRPLLLEQPVMPRVSTGNIVQGWLIFEVPARLAPAALVVIPGDQMPEQRIEIPHQP